MYNYNTVPVILQMQFIIEHLDLQSLKSDLLSHNSSWVLLGFDLQLSLRQHFL